MEKINTDYKGQNWQLKFAQTVTKTLPVNVSCNVLMYEI